MERGRREQAVAAVPLEVGLQDVSQLQGVTRCDKLSLDVTIKHRKKTQVRGIFSCCTANLQANIGTCMLYNIMG